MDQRPLLDSSDSDDNRYEITPTSSQLSNFPYEKKTNFAVGFKDLSKIVKHGSVQKLKEVMKERNIELSDSTGATILHIAAATNNEEVLKTLFHYKRCSVLLNRQDLSGATPLMATLQSQSYKTMELLCLRGVDPTKAYFKSGETALHIASLNQDEEGAKILLKYFNSPAFMNLSDSCGDTALTTAVHVNSAVFYVLLDAGADITIQHAESGRTVLHVAVAYNRKDMVIKTLRHPNATYDFVEVKDVQGDTALIIAVKLQNIDLVNELTNTFTNLNGINDIEHTSVLHLASESNNLAIMIHLLNRTSINSLDYFDHEHRTPILYAAELDSADCLKELIEFGADFHLKNPSTGETLLHVIARKHSNLTLPFVMSLPHITWLLIQMDYEGNTPYMSAIKEGNDTFLRKSFKVKKVDLCEYSPEGETTAYYAVKQGYPNVLFALLLSRKYYSFARQVEGVLDLSDPDVLINAEVRGDIYATDLYILIRKVVKYPLIQYFPPNLLIKSKRNASVFHACGLGGSLECLKFLYNFFKLFAPRHFLYDFDSPGKRGDTPLSVAAQCGVPSYACVYFFVTNGANMASTNYSGLNVIQAIFSYNHDASKLFIKLLNSCVTAEKEYYFSDRLDIKINFNILCPKGEGQMKVINLLFNETKDNDRRKLLLHPVLVYFLRKKLSHVRCLLYTRFFIEVILTLTISFMIPAIYIVDEDPIKKYGLFMFLIMYVILMCMIVASTFKVLFKIPFILKRKLWFSDVMAFVPPISMISLVFCGRSFYFIPELAVVSIMSSWACLLIFATNIYSQFSYQIAMFFRLVNSIAQHLLVLLALTFAFALSFTCIYHEDPRMSHFPTCFIYLFTVMLPGSILDTPTFKKEYYKNTPLGFHLVVEYFLLGVFIITVITGFVNMLVGLAVRGGKYLDVDGKIYQNYHTAHYLKGIEFWFDNKFYYWLSSKPKFTFLKKYKQNTIVDIVINVYDDENKKILDDELVRQLRSIVFKRNKSENSDASEEGIYADDVTVNAFGHLPGARVA